MLSEIDWNAVVTLFVYDSNRPMLFNTTTFFLFFLISYAVFLTIRKQVFWRTVYFFLFSLFFYYKSSGIFFILLIISTLIDFVLGHYIYNASSRGRQRLFLVFSIIANLGLLGYFKYTNFFMDTSNRLFGTGFAMQDIFLPVGISFFTFQTMSYSIDVYRRKIIPLTDQVSDVPTFLRQLLDFGFFVSFFPQLVAGPIVRAADFIPQIRQHLQLDRFELGTGILLIISGLFKKAVISDYISVNFVDRVFESPSLYSGLENLLAAYGYAIQIYCDFSGYSDMAIGLALLLGFKLPENFRSPYQAISIQDFWRRWHISLSTWLRDYLYISLGGNRQGKVRTYLNLMITMLLGGLWHGASWVFIVWGGLHGLGLAIDRYLSEFGKIFARPVFRILVVMLLVQAFGQVSIWMYAGSDLASPELIAQLTAANISLAFLWVGITLVAVSGDTLLQKIMGQPNSFFERIASVVLVFHFVTLGWIFFRSGAPGNLLTPLEITGDILTQILTAFHPELASQLIAGYSGVFALIILGFVLHYLPYRWEGLFRKGFIEAPLWAKSLALALVIWVVIQTTSSEIVPFIYFQF